VHHVRLIRISITHWALEGRWDRGREGSSRLRRDWTGSLLRSKSRDLLR